MVTGYPGECRPLGPARARRIDARRKIDDLDPQRARLLWPHRILRPDPLPPSKIELARTFSFPGTKSAKSPQKRSFAEPIFRDENGTRRLKNSV